MQLKTLLRKELLDVIRDKRTIISMIVVPLVAIPLLTGGFAFLMYKSEQKVKEATYKVAVDEKINDKIVDFLSKEKLEPIKTSSTVIESLIISKQVHAGIMFDSVSRAFVILYDASNRRSEESATRCEQALMRYRETVIDSNLKEMGIRPESIKPFDIKRTNLARPRKMFGTIFGTLIGYLIVILMFAMSSSPTVDLVTGEKERKTLEILLSSPANRMEIILAKLSAIVIVGLVSLTLYILGYVVSMGGILRSILPAEVYMGANINVGVSFWTVLALFFTILPFIIFAASVEIAIASFARSYKEAQSYLSPLIIIVIFPAIAGFASIDTSVSIQQALIPIYNLTQLIKALLAGELSVGIWLLGFLANTLYAAIAVAAAFYIFNKEEILIRG